MKKKCYNCEKNKEGSVISTGVFVCYDCQIEQDRYDSEERYADEQRLGSTTTKGNETMKTIQEFERENEITNVGIYVGGYWRSLSEWFPNEEIEVGELVHDDKHQTFKIYAIFVDGVKYGWMVWDSAGCDLRDPDDYPPTDEGLATLIGE